MVSREGVHSQRPHLSAARQRILLSSSLPAVGKYVGSLYDIVGQIASKRRSVIFALAQGFVNLVAMLVGIFAPECSDGFTSYRAIEAPPEQEGPK